MNRISTFVLAILVVLLPAAPSVRAASCNGAAHQPILSDGTASPASATPSTSVTFSVRFTDTGGCAPTSITVVVQGAGTYALNGSGTAYDDGVTFSRRITLPAGRYPYAFHATSGTGPAGTKSTSLTDVSPSSVLVVAPTPKPTPAPTQKPTSAPTAKPTPAPTATPMVQPAPPPPPPPAASPPQPAPTSTDASPTPDATSTAPSTPSPTPTPAAPTPTPAGSASPTPTPPTPLHDSWVGPTGRMPPGEPELDPAAIIGAIAASVPFVEVLAPYLAATGIGLGWYFVLMRRRTPGEPVAAGAALASGAAVAQEAVTVPDPPSHAVLPPMRELIPPVDPNLLADPDEGGGADPSEVGVPRWLRPSVRAARFADSRDRPRLTWDG